MAFQQVPETVEINYVMDLNNHVYGYRFYAQKPGGYDQSAIDSLAVTMDAAGGGQFAAIQSTADAYVRTEVRGLDAVNDIVSSNGNSATAGGVPYFPLPMNVGFCITKRSGLTGAAGRGRFYFAGVPRIYKQDTANNSDKIQSTYADAILAVVDGIRAGIQGLGVWDPVLVSRYFEGTKRSQALVLPWTSSEYRTLTIASSRSRLHR